MTPYIEDNENLLPGFDARAFVVPRQRSPLGDKAASASSKNSMSPTLWKLEPATTAKHRLYEAYLNAWFPILLQCSWIEKVTYVDAFAGPGKYEDGEDGSPLFAIRNVLNHKSRLSMNLSRERVTMIFVEARRDRYEHLMGCLTEEFGPLDELPITVVVKHGRAERDLMPLLDAHGAWGSPILAVFDSWGNVSVPWTDVRRIARNPRSEVIVTFGPNWFSRREEQNPGQLDAVFGGREFWTPSDPNVEPRDRWETWLTTYKSAIKRAGLKYPLTFRVLPKKSAVPLDLVFGTDNPKGVEAFKQAMWSVDYEEGMRFYDPRTSAGQAAALAASQLDLFDDSTRPDGELLGFVMLMLAEKPATLLEIGGSLELDTPRWRAKHARAAVEYLLREGAIVSDSPHKRLTRTTQLRLWPGY